MSDMEYRNFLRSHANASLIFVILFRFRFCCLSGRYDPDNRVRYPITMADHQKIGFLAFIPFKSQLFHCSHPSV